MTAIKGSGASKYAIYENDVLTDAFYPFGNNVNLEINPESETVEIISNDDDSYGQILDTDTETKGVKITLSSNRFDPQTLAFLMQANLTELSGSGGTVTSEAFTATLGAASKVPQKDLSSVTVTDSTETTTYTLDTDYTLDAELGFITPIDGGAISAGESLRRNYTYGAETDYRIDVNAAPSRKIFFYWKGKNRLDGKRWIVEVPIATIKPNGSINLMAKEPIEGSFDMSAILADGETVACRMWIAK